MHRAAVSVGKKVTAFECIYFLENGEMNFIENRANLLGGPQISVDLKIRSRTY